jgi:hypothetical protein
VVAVVFLTVGRLYETRAGIVVGRLCVAYVLGAAGAVLALVVVLFCDLIRSIASD